jgi:23S rRNA (cytosine1962-C5)-methyltransferase
MSSLPPLRLKKKEDRRLRAGHLWVYSNEIDTKATPLAQFRPGDQVLIEAGNGQPLGVGYVNPNSLICARLVSRDAAYRLDRSLLVHRLNIALSLRRRLFSEPYYRLVYAEADWLPGLIVDRYGDYLVVQCTTAGMDQVKEAVTEALQKVVDPRGILFRNDIESRRMEGLAIDNEVVGEMPASLDVVENGVRFEVSPHTGQKTGWFFDQRANRARLATYARDARVLDLFSYVGAWGVQAAVRGAREVICGDSSEAALQAVAHNARRNGVADLVSTSQGDAVDILKRLRDAGERFDLVVLDPPAFIKRRKDSKAGEQAYHRINQLGMQLVDRDGVLISASCSRHLASERLEAILLGAARHLNRGLQILERGHQGPDHPVHPAIPETAYLKACFCRVIRE